MANELILLERRDAIAICTLNRPEKRNALNRALVDCLSQTLRELKTDSGLRALVLKGAGEKAFVAGADIAELKERGAEESLLGINSSLFREVEEFPVLPAKISDQNERNSSTVLLLVVTGCSMVHKCVDYGTELV